MNNTEQILKAIEIASLAHHGQTRKYSDIPYVVHTIRVAQKVSEYNKYLENKREMVLIAILHDVKEDTSFPMEEIEKLFGKEIVEGILYLTNKSKGSSLKRAERKKMDREFLKTIPNKYKIIKMFDRLDNLNDVANCKKDFIQLYCSETLELIPCLEEADHELADQLRSKCKQLM